MKHERTQRQKRKNRVAWINVLPMTLFSIFFILGPMVYMVLVSFLSRSESGFDVTLPFTLKNYQLIGHPDYLGTFITSLQLAFVSTAFVILIGYPFGYFMAKLTQKWKSRLMSLLMIPFWVSSLLRLNGWKIFFRANGPLDRLLMSIRIIDEPLGLLYSYPIVVLGTVYALLPFMIFAVYSSAEKLDWGLVEAARDLGASPFRAFVTISLPLTIPGLLSGVILTFIPSMGLFFIADILGGNKIVLVGNLIREQNQVGRNLPFSAALSVVLMILTTLLIWLYRKIAKADELEGMV